MSDYTPFDAGGFSQEARELIREYEAEGWTFAVSGAGHAIGRAPDGVTTCSVSRRLSRANRSYQNSEAPLKAWRRRAEGKQQPTLVDLAKPMIRAMEGFHPHRVAVVAAAVALGWEPEQMVNGAIRLHRSGAAPIIVRKSERDLTKREDQDIRHRAINGGDPMVGAMAARMTQDEWAEYVMDIFDDSSIRTRVAVVPSTTPKPSDDLPGEHLRVAEPDVALASDSAGEPPMETRRAWTARRGGRRTYESKAVEEIIDAITGEVRAYGCSKCDATAEDPHFIAAHYRRAHRFRRGREEQNPDLPEPSEYHPSERLIRALMEYLDSHVPPGTAIGDEDSSRFLAENALRWMNDRPDLPPPGPVVPLTDAQIVERIRRLVGAEDHLEEVETLTEEVERLEARVADLEAFLAEADARADRLQADIDTWLSLAPRPASG